MTIMQFKPAQSETANELYTDEINWGGNGYNMFTCGQDTEFYARGFYVIERSCVNQRSTWLPSDTR